MSLELRNLAPVALFATLSTLLPALPAGAQVDSKLPPFEVVRTGRAFDEGDSTPFPRKRAPGVVFGEGFLLGETREDGFFDIARSQDGRKLFTRIGTDDGIESNATFQLESQGALPPDAILQMVDGYFEVVPEIDPDLGSQTVKSIDNKRVLKRYHEAWVALPKQRLIVRPSTKATYPLVPAVGSYDEAKATKAQWVVYVSKCRENKGRACVYYGPAAAACARSIRAHEHEGLLVVPNRCPSPSS